MLDTLYSADSNSSACVWQPICVGKGYHLLESPMHGQQSALSHVSTEPSSPIGLDIFSSLFATRSKEDVPPDIQDEVMPVAESAGSTEILEHMGQPACDLSQPSDCSAALLHSASLVQHQLLIHQPFAAVATATGEQAEGPVAAWPLDNSTTAADLASPATVHRRADSVVSAESSITAAADSILPTAAPTVTATASSRGVRGETASALISDHNACAWVDPPVLAPGRMPTVTLQLDHLPPGLVPGESDVRVVLAHGPTVLYDAMATVPLDLRFRVQASMRLPLGAVQLLVLGTSNLHAAAVIASAVLLVLPPAAAAELCSLFNQMQEAAILVMSGSAQLQSVQPVAACASVGSGVTAGAPDQGALPVASAAGLTACCSYIAGTSTSSFNAPPVNGAANLGTLTSLQTAAKATAWRDHMQALLLDLDWLLTCAVQLKAVRQQLQPHTDAIGTAIGDNSAVSAIHNTSYHHHTHPLNEQLPPGSTSLLSTPGGASAAAMRCAAAQPARLNAPGAAAAADDPSAEYAQQLSNWASAMQLQVVFFMSNGMSNCACLLLHVMSDAGLTVSQAGVSLDAAGISSALLGVDDITASSSGNQPQLSAGACEGSSLVGAPVTSIEDALLLLTPLPQHSIELSVQDTAGALSSPPSFCPSNVNCGDAVTAIKQLSASPDALVGQQPAALSQSDDQLRCSLPTTAVNASSTMAGAAIALVKSTCIRAQYSRFLQRWVAVLLLLLLACVAAHVVGRPAASIFFKSVGQHHCPALLPNAPPCQR